ncbi:MAG TPA: hypothetical protein VFO94_04505 [Gammaproteobacteria bacterium]|nr:hypothetical protein [Gammaproteobacteria bacterium]
MQTATLDIERLAAEFTAAHPDLNASEQRLALALVRQLAEGEPVRPEDLAERLGCPATDVSSNLERLPMVQRDDGGRIVAYRD